MIGKTIQELNLGDSEQIQKTISETDVYLYAGITGDLNPAHVNEEYAKKTFFKTRIAHGMLTAGFISTISSPIKAFNPFTLRVIVPVWYWKRRRPVVSTSGYSSSGSSAGGLYSSGINLPLPRANCCVCSIGVPGWSAAGTAILATLIYIRNGSRYIEQYERAHAKSADARPD